MVNETVTILSLTQDMASCLSTLSNIIQGLENSVYGQITVLSDDPEPEGIKEIAKKNLEIASGIKDRLHDLSLVVG